MADQIFWADFWTGKSKSDTDFQATGRGTMDSIGFLYTVRECAKILNLSQSDQLLDVGGGTGLIALALSPFVGRILTLDLSPGITERAQKNLSDAENVEVGSGSITDLPCENETYSKVLVYSVLQYLENEQAVAKAIAEIGRVLKKGGVALLAANPDPNLFENYLQKRCGNDKTLRAQEIEFQKDLRWVSREKCVEIAHSCGLEAHALDIHPRIWQSFYMFDLVLKK